MRCEDCLRGVEEYSDGELSYADAVRVRAHLAACESCREAHEALRREQEIYSLYARELELTPPLWEGVRARIEREKARPPAVDFSPSRGNSSAMFGRLFSRPVPLAAAALLLFFVFAAGVKNFVPDAERLDAAQTASQAAPAPRGESTGEARTTGEASVADVADGQSSAMVPSHVNPHAARVTRSRTQAASSSRMLVAERVPAEGAVPPTPDEFVSEAIAAGNIEKIEDAVEAYEYATDDATSGVAGAAREAYARDSARHFERAQLLLRSLKNLRQNAGRETLDIAYEKQQSKRLLYRNTLLKQEAEMSGNLPEKEMLGSLEPLLLEIANLPDRATQNDIRAVKERMRGGEIIGALQIYARVPEK